MKTKEELDWILKECEDIIIDGNWGEYEGDILKRVIPLIKTKERERIIKELKKHIDCPCGNHNVNGEDIGCIQFILQKLKQRNEAREE